MTAGDVLIYLDVYRQPVKHTKFLQTPANISTMGLTAATTGLSFPSEFSTFWTKSMATQRTMATEIIIVLVGPVMVGERHWQ